MAEKEEVSRVRSAADAMHHFAQEALKEGAITKEELFVLFALMQTTASVQMAERGFQLMKATLESMEIESLMGVESDPQLVKMAVHNAANTFRNIFNGFFLQCLVVMENYDLSDKRSSGYAGSPEQREEIMRQIATMTNDIIVRMDGYLEAMSEIVNEDPKDFLGGLL